MPNPAPLEPTECPNCGGPTQQAFGPSRNYVACRRCGRVFAATEPTPGYCPKCKTDQPFTGKHKVNADRQDPSEIYELVCGHWIL